VLIVEDDNMISAMYRTKLEQDGFVVAVADNGATGVELAKSEKPDIIMMDVILPQLDGFSALEAIKNDPKTKKIKVIMLTNLGTNEDKQKGEKLGAADYLVKANLTPAQVSEAIKKYLQ
jgi:DNA-binding response OmpR family regulator